MRTLALSVLGLASLLVAGCDSSTSSKPDTHTKWCMETCKADADCSGLAGDWTCKESMCTPKETTTATGCKADAECIKFGLAGNKACTKDSECDVTKGEGDVCVEDGGGTCATQSATAAVAGGCATYGGVDHDTKKKEGATEIKVCANKSAPYCSASGTCDECKADTDCTGKAFTKCTTGWCIGCGSDAECKGDLTKCYPDATCGCKADTECKVAGYPVCNTSEGYCGCKDDAGCTALNQKGYDKCYPDGMCGCAATTSCTATKTFGGTTWSCADVM